MGKKLYLKLMKYSFPERKKRALETYTMEMEVLEKMSFRELNFEYVNTKAAYEQKEYNGNFCNFTHYFCIDGSLERSFFDDCESNILLGKIPN